MADNFNLRAFLSENKLTKNAKLIKEGSDYGFEALMDAADDLYPEGTPENGKLVFAIEKALHSNSIDTSEFGDDLGAAARAVEAIANEIGLGDEQANDIEQAQHDMERQFEETVEEAIQESRLTTKERRLVEMVQTALGVKNLEENIGAYDQYPLANYMRGDSDKKEEPKTQQEPEKKSFLQKAKEKLGFNESEEQTTYSEGEESIEEVKPLPKYSSIEELMKEIEHGTNEAAHEYKMREMKRVYEALEAKVGSLEEGEHAEHIDQKAVKQMRKDIAALRKAEEKLRKEFDKKFAGKAKKEAPKKEEEAVSLAEGFDLRKFLVENRK